jgi:hypothetical protein
MLLRDNDGEITVSIGDLFQVRTGAKGEYLGTFEAICIDSRSGSVNPVVCCRLHEGDILFEGRRGSVGDLLNCTGEVVAAGVRTFRKGAAIAVPIQPKAAPHPKEWTALKTASTRKTEKRQKSDHPTKEESFPLFD